MKTQEQTASVGELLFEEKLRLTNIVDYGVTWQDLVSGQASPNQAGIPFDLAFEGTLTGDKIRGAIKGIDFLEVRADGRFNMHIHATITTDDGTRIALREDGLLGIPSDGSNASVRLALRFLTASPKYAWLNNRIAWAHGEADTKNATVDVKVWLQ